MAMVKKYKITLEQEYWDCREYDTEERAIEEIQFLLQEGWYPDKTFSIVPVYRNE